MTSVPPSFFSYLLRLADDRLVLGHRLSEWCGHGPILEEDIALANVSLDLIGEATLLLKLAGETEGRGRNEDALAYFRHTGDYRNAIIAAKAVKESRYHVRHSAEWVVTLGDGTDESHARTQRSVDELWRYTGELFMADAIDREVSEAGLGVNPETIADRWREEVGKTLERATLTIPPVAYMQRGGREGKHTEHLGHMLAEMQIVARSHPGAKW